MIDQTPSNTLRSNAIPRGISPASRGERGAVLAVAMAMLSATSLAYGQAGTAKISPLVVDNDNRPVSVPNATTIVYHMDCPDEAGDASPTSVTLTAPNGGIIFSPLEAVFELPKLPADSRCEWWRDLPTNPPAGYLWPTMNQPGTTAGEFYIHDFIVFRSGGLQIIKTVDRPLPVDVSFEFTVACTHPDTAVTPIPATAANPSIAIPAGAITGSRTIAAIADGSTCTATQAPPPSLPGYTWGPTPGPNADIAITNSVVTTTEFSEVLTPDDALFADGFDVAAPNPVQDGRFEATVDGTSPWITSDFDFCDIPSCGDGGNTAGPRSGNIWVWLGGSANEVATVSQTVMILSGGPRYLNFWLWIGYIEGLGSELVVNIDGVEVASYPEPAEAEAGYTQRSVDISAYADDAAHTIEFRYTGTFSNYNLDDVSIDSTQAPPPRPVSVPQRPNATATLRQPR